MATEKEINEYIDAISRVFGKDVVAFEVSLEAIKVNTDKVTLDNEIEKIRKEIRKFTEEKEAEIQTLLGMK